MVTNEVDPSYISSYSSRTMPWSTDTAEADICLTQSSLAPSAIEQNRHKMKKRTIDYCRNYYQLHEGISDAEISEKCKGSLGEALYELRTAIDALKSAVKEKLKPWLIR